MSPIRKVLSFANFVRVALKEARSQKDVDIVFATSTPLTIGYIALRLKKRKHFPYVFEVRDLWPEFPIQIGAVTNKLAIKYLRGMEKRIYNNAEFIVTLSPGMQEGVVSTGIPVEKTTMIPNMSKPDVFFPHEKNFDVANQFGIDLKRFNVVHFGSMGKANGLSYIIDAAKELKNKNDRTICFIFMGDGATQPKLKKEVEDNNLDNVLFLGNHPMSVVVEVVNCCDASITSFMNLPILKTNSPNKLFDSLSAGKPIIVNSDGWTRRLVEEENCGFYVDPEHPEELADKLIEISKDQELLDNWSSNSRRLSIEKFDQKLLSAKVADVIENVYKSIKNINNV